MTHSQSPRGSLRKKPPFQATNGSRARPLDFDVDLELDIDWDGLGFGSSPRPSPVPASTAKPAPTCDNAPVSRIGEKKAGPELDRPGQPRSEEDEGPTSVYPARAPAPENPQPAGSSTLIMDHAKVVASASPENLTSGQTLVMTREQLLSQSPQPAPAREEGVVVTKVMSMGEVVGRHATPDRELTSDVSALPDEDSGPHTKMMPIDVLMKRANAQQRWPLPGVQVRAEVRESSRKGSKAPSFFARLGDGWRKTSLVRKASLLLMPLLCVLMLARYGKLPGLHKPARGKTAVAAASAARRVPHANPSGEPAPSEPLNALPAPSASGAPAASTSAAPPASAALAASSEPAPASTGGPPPARANGVTAQRKAADAVAEGDYAAAVERYRSLAREEPGVQAYPEAARILEERANAARR